MDATTNSRTLAVAFTVLLVGAVFVGAVPAAAVTVNATAATDVGIDASVTNTITLDATVLNTTGTVTVSNINNVTDPADTKLRYNSTYDLNFYNVYTSSGGYGYTGGATNLILVNPAGATVNSAVPLPSGCGASNTVCNVTFPNQKLDATGVWTLQTPSNAVVARVFVYPATDLSVTVSPNTLPYATTATLFTVGVTNASGNVNGATVYSTATNFVQSGVTTNGVYQFFNAPPGVGNFPIYASQDFGGQTVGGFDIPEFRNSATLTVTGLTLNVIGNATNAIVGFSNEIKFTPQLSDGKIVFSTGGGNLPAGFSGYNVSIQVPDNYLLFANVTQTTVASGVQSLTCYNLSVVGGACGGYNPATGAVLTANGDGSFTFKPGDDASATATNVWDSGTYTFTVQLQTAGGASSAPEYTGSLGITPAAPAAVNLAFTSDPLAANPNTLDVRTAASSTPQGYTVYVFINGTTQFEHPACRDAPGCANPGDDVSAASFVSNVTVRGDVLPGATTTAYNAATGMATITGVKPTRNGTVFIDVAWKNATTTLTVPVINGAVIELSQRNMTVDQTTTLVVTVKDAFGNTQPSATVQLFKLTGGALTSADITGSTSIVGTGANETLGQNGRYTFNVKPLVVQDLVVYATLGNGNASYANISVLPAQDLTVSITPTQTMAALNTTYLLNVTNATGIGATTTAGNYRVYLLNATQRTNLLVNGTTGLFSSTNGPNLRGVSAVNNSATSANFTATLTAGDYYVYVCSGTSSVADCSSTSASHDNRLNMPMINVTEYTATFSPNIVASSADIQSNVVVSVTVKDRNGAPANGTLRIAAGSLGGDFLTAVSPANANTTAGVSVTNGVANITMTGRQVGTVNFEFDPLEASGTNFAQFALVLGNLSVAPGNLSFTPSKVPILQSTLVTIKLENFTGAGLPGRVIRLCGIGLNPNFGSTFPNTLSATNETNCPASDVTQSDGSAGIVVSPNSLQPIGIFVNGSFTGKTIPVIAGTLSVTVTPAAPKVGDNVTITASQANQPSAGISISVTRNGTFVLNQTTDSAGRVMLPSVTAGTYTVLATRSGFENGTATFTVGPSAAANNTTAKFVLSNLVIPDRVNVGQAITVSADIENQGGADGTANAILLVNNAQRGTQSVFVAKGDKETVAFDFTPTVAGTYQVTIRLATGETLASETVTVGTPTTPTTNVTATVTTTTSPTSSGTPTTTTTTTAPPTTTGTPATTTPTPKVPGFEVVALLAAFAIALLVLRRRN